MNTEKSPLISVIVPVYKVEKYLPVWTACWHRPTGILN